MQMLAPPMSEHREPVSAAEIRDIVKFVRSMLGPAPPQALATDNPDLAE